MVVCTGEEAWMASSLLNKFLKRKTSAIHDVRPDLVAIAVNKKGPMKEGAGSVLKTT